MYFLLSTLKRSSLFENVSLYFIDRLIRNTFEMPEMCRKSGMRKIKILYVLSLHLISVLIILSVSF